MRHLTLWRLTWRSSLLVTLWSALLLPTTATAQASADSVTAWTRTMQVGPTLAARDAALAKLASLSAARLPAETRRVLVAELNRVHLALKAGTAIGAVGEDEEGFSDYYTTLVLVVAAIETPEAALSLVPAVAVSGGVARQVAQRGDTAVALLAQQLLHAVQPDEHAALLESLGLAWFWADSTGSPLSDRSRAQIVAALSSAALSTTYADMVGMEVALRAIRDPGFLPLAQRVREFALTQGVRGRGTVVSIEDDVIPPLTTLAASRSPSSLAQGLARLVTAVCGNDATGRRNGACQSLTNDVAAASNHLANGRTTPARNGFESVSKKIDRAYAEGAFSDAEHALLAGNVAIVLQRLAP